MAAKDKTPGESPFKALGVVYTGARDYYETGAVPGGYAAVLPHIVDPALRKFAEQPFVYAGFYDALPIVGISQAAAMAAGLTHKELAVRNARWLAERDIGRVFRFLLQSLSPPQVALRLPKASMRFFQFGTAEASLIDDCMVEAKQTQVPTALALWMIWSVEGFAPVALEMAGATNVRVLMAGAPQRDGEVDGFETSTLLWRIRWST
jgi:hypothetical protein